MDKELQHFRRLAAQGDVEAAAQVLVLRMRSYGLPRENVEMAALLDHQPSILAIGRQRIVPKYYGVRPAGIRSLHTPEMAFGEHTKRPTYFDKIFAICDKDPGTGLQLAVNAAVMVANYWDGTMDANDPGFAIAFGERYLRGEIIDKAVGIIVGETLINIVENIHAEPAGDAVRAAAQIPFIVARLDETPTDYQYYIFYTIGYAASALGRYLRLDLATAKQQVFKHSSQQLIEQLLT